MKTSTDTNVLPSAGSVKKNPFETQNLSIEASPEKDMLPERDPEFENDYFNNMYHEHLRRKEEIRKRIERLTREKNFLEQLQPSEVQYMFQKKKEENLKDEKEMFDKQYSPQKKREDAASASPERDSRVVSLNYKGSPSTLKKTFTMTLNKDKDSQAEQERRN